jgi:hypothetical protein
MGCGVPALWMLHYGGKEASCGRLRTERGKAREDSERCTVGMQCDVGEGMEGAVFPR